MEIVKINAEKRESTGKKATKAVRRSGKIPAVLYGKDVNVQFVTDKRSVKPLIYTPNFKVAEIEIDGKQYKSVIRDIVFHPVTEEIQHIDFVNLTDGRKLKFEIPVRFTGTSPGVKNGGKLIQGLRRIKIKATPESLIPELTADISTVELGEAVRVRDLELAEGIEILTPGATPIAVVEVPRALKSATAEEEAEEAAEEATEEEATTEE